jgi:hypothetical protein
MTCRHKDGDPNCTTRNPERMRAQALSMVKRWAPDQSPDPSNYRVVKAHQAGTFLILEVKYPSCAKCAYEGNKVMVFDGVTAQEALIWTRIDPHFRDPAKKTGEEAPSPVARFPASPTGWSYAIDLCRFLLTQRADP